MNWARKSSLVWLGLLLSGSTALAMVSEPPCLEEGGTTTVGAERPPLGQAGDPVGAKWAGKNETGNPRAFEDDPFSPDDPMGNANGGDPADVDVDSKGGNLSGPNGNVQNGFGEGDCIEVKIRWTYLYPVLKCTGSSALYGLGGSGGGPTSWRCSLVWLKGYKESEPQTVCPC